MGYWDRQTPASRISVHAFAGAVIAGGVRILADYLDSTLLAGVSTAAVLAFILWGGWAIVRGCNR